jgi:intein/homing endonuclease
MSFQVIKKGDRNDLVGDWQSFLRGEKIYLGAIDDDFGNATDLATKKFQKKYGLTDDGVVGNSTYQKAIELGFHQNQVVISTTDNSNVPPKPNFLPITGNLSREKLFGKFDYKASPTKQNPEGIIITDDWESKNIVRVNLPALSKATNGKFTAMRWHNECEYQLVKMFERFEKENLHTKILSFAGAFYPRYIRGSRTQLSNHCLTAEQNVWTTEGVANIGDLKGFNGKVWSYNNGVASKCDVINFFNNGKKKILKITVQGHTIRCTENHPILVLRKNTFQKENWIKNIDKKGFQKAEYYVEMVKAENIIKGDRVVILKELPEQVIDFDERKLMFAEILGLFLGDGCIHHKKNKAEYVSFHFPKGDRVRDYVIDLLTKYFSESPKEVGDSHFCYYKESIFSNFLFYDKLSFNKEIPTEVWGWNNKMKCRFILGLLYSDGFVNENKSKTGGGYSSQYVWKMSSEKLIQDLKYLLTSVGISTSKISEVSEEIKIIKNIETISKKQWSIKGNDIFGVLNPEQDELYLSRVQNNLHKHQFNSKCYGYEEVNPNFTHKIVQDIKYDGYEDVFDIEVDNLHNFITSGVVVSNSWGTAFDVNVPQNGLNKVPAMIGEIGCVRELVPIANECGFYWGGHFGKEVNGKMVGRLDGMHFEIAKIINENL